LDIRQARRVSGKGSRFAPPEDGVVSNVSDAVVLAWKFMNEANQIRFELKYRKRECHG
jgi:hypothetical protein